MTSLPAQDGKPVVEQVISTNNLLDELSAAYNDSLVEALLDAMAYRVLAQEAIHALAAVVRDRDRLEQRYHELLNSRRAAR